MPSAFVRSRGIKVFISSLPGQNRPGEEENQDVYNWGQKMRSGLVRSFAPLCNSGSITLWHDGLLIAGQEWQEDTAATLADAEIILLLLSPDFFNSPFCYAQMEQALQRREKEGISVIPIYLRPVVGREAFPIDKIFPLPGPEVERSIASEPDQDLAWYEVVQALQPIIRLLSDARTPGISTQEEQALAFPASPVYRDVLLKRPPVPEYAPAISRTALVEEMYQCFSESAHVTTLILTGLSGAGKTTLAAQLYYLAERERRAGRGPFARAPLWLEIESTSSLVDVVGSLSSVLERPLQSSFCDLAPKALAEELFSLLETAGCLVVFDQFEQWFDAQSGHAFPAYAGVDEWLKLLNAGSECFSGRVLLTSHVYPRRLFYYGTACALHREVPDLTEQEGIQLLRLEHAPTLAHATEKELAAFVERCQGHALTLVALRKRCVRDASLRPAELLHTLYADDQWMDEMLFQTLNTYTERFSRKLRALLQAFATFREAVPLEAAHALVSSRHRSTMKYSSDVLTVLLELDWLQASGQGKYRLRSVIAGFVRRKRNANAQRAMHIEAARYYQTYFPRLFLPEGLQERADFSPVVEAIWHLCQAGQGSEAYRLLRETELFVYLHRWGQNSALLPLYLNLLEDTEWQPEIVQAARLYHELGEIRNALGQKHEALQTYRQSLDLFRQASEMEGVVEALNNMGAMHRALQEYQQARACYQEALSICSDASARFPQQGTTLNNLGRLAFDLGNQEASREPRFLSERARSFYEEALACYQQALALYQADALFAEEAMALNNLGDVSQELGHDERALDCYQRALIRFQELSNQRSAGLSYNSLGKLYKKMAKQEGNPAFYDNARVAYEKALRLFREVDDRWQERIVLSNLGRFYATTPGLAEGERYRLSLAFSVQARRLAAELCPPQDEPVPHWIEHNIRLWLAQSDSQAYEVFLREIEAQAETIVDQIIERVGVDG